MTTSYICRISYAAYDMQYIVRKSLHSGYSIVTHGPKSDFKNVACETNSAIFGSTDLNLSGTYGIRIESRENNELGIDHNSLMNRPLYTFLHTFLHISAFDNGAKLYWFTSGRDLYFIL